MNTNCVVGFFLRRSSNVLTLLQKKRHAQNRSYDKTKQEREWQPNWLNSRPWLVYDQGLHRSQNVLEFDFVTQVPLDGPEFMAVFLNVLENIFCVAM